MLFEPDIAVYKDRVRERIGDELFNRLRFFVHGQHNHEGSRRAAPRPNCARAELSHARRPAVPLQPPLGPDTSGLGGPVNRDYFDFMFEQMVDATVDALNSREPAELSFGEAKHAFGLGDRRDPLIYDRTVHILRAHPAGNTTAPPIMTLVQWGMHPEITLGYQPTVPDEDCLALGREPGCSARGQFFTGDYPGNFRRVLQQLDGSREVLYFNGAIGSQIGNHGPVWEVSEEFPIEGAQRARSARLHTYGRTGADPRSIARSLFLVAILRRWLRDAAGRGRGAEQLPRRLPHRPAAGHPRRRNAHAKPHPVRRVRVPHRPRLLAHDQPALQDRCVGRGAETLQSLVLILAPALLFSVEALIFCVGRPVSGRDPAGRPPAGAGLLAAPHVRVHRAGDGQLLRL